jgi:hypothetical protein
MLSTRKVFSSLLGLVLVLSASARGADPSKYVPADAEMVLHINVQQLLDSKLAQKYALPPLQQALKDNKEVQQVLTLLGLDPLKDITTLTVSNAGQSGDKAQAVLTGKFSLDKIQATAAKVAEDKKEKLKISKIGDKPLYEAAQQGKPIYAGFADGSTLVVSLSRDYVADALGGKTGKINKGLADVVATVDGKQTIWIASVVTDEVKKQLANQPQAAEFAKKLKAITGGIHVTDAMAIGVKVQTTDAKAARDLSEFTNQAKTFLQFAGQSNEELKPFVDEIINTLEIKTQGADLSVKFKLSEEIIEKAIKKIPGQ